MNNFDETLERAAQIGNEYPYGAIAKDLAAVPVAERIKYLPDGVLQYNNVFDSHGCASRSVLNILECKLDYFYDHGMFESIKKWCDDSGYRVQGKFKLADAFIEILSGTTPTGNSLKAPVETLRKYGAIPMHYLPLEENMTWDAYMNKKRITQEMLDLGREFLKRISLGYEQVFLRQFNDALLDDLLDVAAYAWPMPVNGVYPATNGPFCHAFTKVNSEIDAFDNYIPYVKRLAKDYIFFDWAYSISITAQHEVEEVGDAQPPQTWWQKVWATLVAIFVPPTPEPTPEPAPEPTAADNLVSVAMSWLGKDPSTPDLVDDELGCADSLSVVLKGVYPDFKRTVSTITLASLLRNSTDFENVLKPSAGCVIVSPREGDQPGHCGIFINDTDIVSNSSATGLWTQNWNYTGWIKYYRDAKGLHTYLYAPK